MLQYAPSLQEGLTGVVAPPHAHTVGPGMPELETEALRGGCVTSVARILPEMRLQEYGSRGGPW